MAKKIVDEQIKLSIVIDGNEAQKKINELEKATIEASREVKNLELQQKQLRKASKENSDEYKQLTARIKELKTTISTNTAEVEKQISALEISDLTIGQLNTKAQLLKTTLKHLVPGTTDYENYNAQLSQVNARLSELRNGAQATGYSLGTVADGFNKYAALGATVIATTTGVVLSIQKMIDYNGKLSDAQSDVMKTTGMTKKEVDELTKSFGLLQTRTQRIDLLKIAEEGGRIGIANKDIQEFVRVMDIAYVALGDSFSGGVEEVASKLGKLKMLFSETKDLGVEDAYMRIGSAINDLGASGVATENNITEFTTRIGSLPEQLKPTIAETLALGAAFEESGIEAEVSARAYSIFLNRASTETEAFAKVMGLPVQKVKEMINANPLEFFLSFAERLKHINPEATEMALLLDELKINADGANKVIGAAANNTQRFRDTIELSNASMESGTSLINEFGVKNNNLAATLEKIKKTITGWFSSDTLVGWLEVVINLFAKLIGATESNSASINVVRLAFLNLFKILVIITAGWFSYNAAVILTTKSIKDFTLAKKILTALQARWAVVTSTSKALYLWLTVQYNTLTGNTLKAAAAQRLLNVTQAANPIGLIIAAIGALVAAFFLFKDEVKQTNAVLLANQKIQEGVGEATNEHKSKVNLLIDVLRSSTSTIEQKEKALIQLKKITNGYLDSLNLENIATLQGINLIGNYIKHIDALARAKATVALKSKLYEELEANNAKIRAKTTEKDTASDGNLFTKYNKDGKFLGMQFGRNKNIIQGEIDELKSDGDFINAQLNAVKKTQNESVNYLTKSIEKDKNQLMWLKKGTAEYINLANKVRSEEERLGAFLQSGNTDVELNIPNEPTGYIPTGDEDKKNKGKSAAEKEADKQKREHEKRLDEIQKYYESALKLARDYEDGNYALMADGYEKEKQILETQHQRAIQDLESKLVSQEEIEKAQNASKNEKLTAEQRKSYENLANAWLKSNEGIYRKVEQETDLHCLKLATTVEKFAQNEIDILNKQYEQEKVAREIAFNDRLTQIGNDQKKRAEEEKKFKDEEYHLELQHLQDLTDLYTKLINNDLGNGIDFDLLTPEAEAKLKADIEKVKLAVSDLKAAKSGEVVKKEGPLESNEANLNLGEVDILGFTQTQWETFYSNIEQGTIGIQTMTMAVFALQNIWSQYGAMVEAGENRRLQQYENTSNKKQQRLQRQLNSGIISQDQYNKAVEAIDNDLARKKAELEYKQAKRKRKMDMASAFTSTALAVLNGLNTQPFFPLGLAMSALAGILGGLQIATIAKQPLPSPGFESGYYSNNVVRRQQDGKLFNSTFGGKTKSGVVSRPTHFLTGENGPEMIIDSKAFRQMNPNLRDSLIREIRSIKGFENGYYNPETMSMNVANDGSVSNGEFLVVLIQIRNFLEKLDREGVRASISNKDLPSMRSLKEGLQNFENFRNRNKVK